MKKLMIIAASAALLGACNSNSSNSPAPSSGATRASPSAPQGRSAGPVMARDGGPGAGMSSGLNASPQTTSGASSGLNAGTNSPASGTTSPTNSGANGSGTDNGSGSSNPTQH